MQYSGFYSQVFLHVSSMQPVGSGLARYMIRSAFALEKLRYDSKSGMAIYRLKLHATVKRNYQPMLALKWLRLLMNHIPDKYKHLVRYYGYYSNRSPSVRRLAEQVSDTSATIVVEKPVDTRHKASWPLLIQKIYEVDPLECNPLRCHDANYRTH